MLRDTAQTTSVVLVVILERQEERSITSVSLCLLNFTGGNKLLKKFIYVIFFIFKMPGAVFISCQFHELATTSVLQDEMQNSHANLNFTDVLEICK